MKFERTYNIEGLKQRLHAKTAKLRRYEINRMFVQNQKRVYHKMDGVRIINNEKANAEESKQCWSNIWDNKKEHESECCMVKGIKSRKRQHETD